MTSPPPLAGPWGRALWAWLVSAGLPSCTELVRIGALMEQMVRGHGGPLGCCGKWKDPVTACRHAAAPHLQASGSWGVGPECARKSRAVLGSSWNAW